MPSKLAAQSDIPAEIRPVVDEAVKLFSRLGGCALLVGVEDYRRFDPSGAKDLRAGRNDVLALWKVCRRLGYRFIRVLTTPRLTLEEIVQAEVELAAERDAAVDRAEVQRRVEGWGLFDPSLQPHGELRMNGEPREVAGVLRHWDSREMTAYAGEASSAEIEAGARWLAEKLGVRVCLEWNDWRLKKTWSQPGLFAYSGHGARLSGDGDLFLCPTNTRTTESGGLEGAISFSALREIFDAEGAAEALTVLLDCCFAGAGSPASASEARSRAATTLAGSSIMSSEPPAHEIGGRVFCAAPRDEQAFQSVLGGKWHGAFTWAMTVALEQWKNHTSNGFSHSSMSHAELLVRTRMLLQALSFDQHPMLVDDLGDMPVFHRAGEQTCKTSPLPTADRRHIQADPTGDKGFAYYKLYANGKLVAQIVSNFEHPSLERNTEYWKIEGTALNTNNLGEVTIERNAQLAELPFSAQSASFTCPVQPVWSSGSVEGWYLVSTDTSGRLAYGLSVDVASRDGIWSGSIRWITDGSARVFKLDGRTAGQSFGTNAATTSVDLSPHNLVMPLTNLLLQGKNGRRVTEHTGYNYARWNGDRAIQHQLVHVSGNGGLRVGDTVYIRTTESTENNKLSAETQFNLAYDSHSRDSEEWTIESPTRATGQLIRHGEAVRFRSKRQNRLLSQESDGYLGTRLSSTEEPAKNLGVDWLLVLP
ncbi:MAG: hypothetical protein HOW73_48940 [Polyangiaceae bacterium]|nr:hypothetical protein [Polyangiaceae bacterium]